VGATSATTYAIVGTLNKIPVTVIGYFVFNAKISNEGLIFVALASAGGLLYGYAKLPKQLPKTAT
jgi:GDP-mannose transporter